MGDELRTVICAYKLCTEWECPLKVNGWCEKYDTPYKEVIRRFLLLFYTNGDFRKHTILYYPEIANKYCRGVQYE